MKENQPATGCNGQQDLAQQRPLSNEKKPAPIPYEDFFTGVEMAVRQVRMAFAKPWFLWLVLLLITSAHVHIPPLPHWQSWLDMAVWFLVFLKIVAVLLTTP